MIIEQYDIRLTRLTKDDIELVREHRNSDSIRQFMAYQKTISKKMQERWFDKINNELNYYFIIEYKGEKIGLINCKDVNLEHMYADGGIFIWKPEIWNTYVPVMATLAFTDSIFYEFKISNKSFIQIIKQNKRAIAYNKRLGYILLPGQEKNTLQRYLLTEADYAVSTEKIRKGLQIITQDFNPPRISGQPDSINLSVINDYLASL